MTPNTCVLSRYFAAICDICLVVVWDLKPEKSARCQHDAGAGQRNMPLFVHNQDLNPEARTHLTFGTGIVVLVYLGSIRGWHIWASRIREHQIRSCYSICHKRKWWTYETMNERTDDHTHLGSRKCITFHTRRSGQPHILQSQKMSHFFKIKSFNKFNWTFFLSIFCIQYW